MEYIGRRHFEDWRAEVCAFFFPFLYSGKAFLDMFSPYYERTVFFRCSLVLVFACQMFYRGKIMYFIQKRKKERNIIHILWHHF